MSQKSPVVYNCQNCLYITDNKKDYNRHLETRKHQQNDGNIVASNQKTCAKCEKTFKYRTSIYRHNKICRGPTLPKEVTMAAPPVPLPELDPASLTLDQIKQLMIENKILKEILSKTGIGTT
jgi:hypothetical protein